MDFILEHVGPLNALWSNLNIQLQQLISTSIESISNGVLMDLIALKVSR